MKWILIALLTMFSVNSYAEQIYLYVMFHDDNSQGERFRTKMKDFSQCLEAIKAAKMPMPNNPSGDYEVMGAMWCGGGMNRNYSGTWWDDKTKTPN